MNANTRRDFVRGAAAGFSGAAMAGAAVGLPKRALGKTGLETTVIGLGGGRVGTLDDGALAGDVIRRAYDLGINYFDSAAAGAYGLSQSRFGRVLKDFREKIILGTKTRHRTWEHAAIDLNQSLANLKTDRIDLYQIHNVLSDEDVENIFRPRGLMELIEKARKDGKIRFVGVTGHASPKVMNRIISRYEFDTILIPLSITDGAADPARSFEKTTLPLARGKGMGIIGMKSLGAGLMLSEKVATVQEAVSYALSLPISTLIMGCDAVGHVNQDVSIAAAARQPLDPNAMNRLRRRAVRFEQARLEPWKSRGPTGG